MKLSGLLQLVADEPVFETGLLLAGDVDAADVRRQLSRWTSGGQLYQMRRGLYTLAPPYQKVKPHPFLIANRLVRSSYVSLQSALAHYGLIPEYVPVVTSVTTTRPGIWDTELGRFEFRHIKPGLFQGYRRLEVAPGQWAFVASPEKALLDLVHLSVGADDAAFLRELRLQNLNRLDLTMLRDYADGIDSPKLQRAVSVIAKLAETEDQEYETL